MALIQLYRSFLSYALIVPPDVAKTTKTHYNYVYQFSPIIRGSPMEYANEKRFDLSDDKIFDRFMNKVSIDNDTGCWNWIAGTTRGGYGKFDYYGMTTRAHRVSYEHFTGLKADYILDHMCNNVKCVNPNHLQPSTTRDNVLRGSGMAPQNARKTQCKNGHPFDGIYVRKDRNSTMRLCSICRREAARKSARNRKK